MTGITGTNNGKKVGDTPPPFSLFTKIGIEEQLSQTTARLNLVTVGILISGLYTLLAVTLEVIVPSDAWIVLIFIFLFLRRPYIKEEIKELQQHLHGEGLPALD